MRNRPILALLTAALLLASCGDTQDPATDDDNNGFFNNTPNNTPNNDAPNNDVNNTPNNDQNNEDDACDVACRALGQVCGDDFLAVCPQEVVDELVPTCIAACDDPDARAQITAVAGLPCGNVVPLAIAGFGLTEACSPDDPCAGVACPAPVGRCDGNVAVTFNGAGVCDDGDCDFSAIEVRTDCGQDVCEGGACVEVGQDDLTIYALQDPGHPEHPAVGAEVVLNNVLVSVNQGGFLWVQEPDGGPHGGIFVEEGAVDISALQPGHRVNLTGVYSENDGDNGLSGLATLALATVEIVAQDNPPAPTRVTIAELSTPEGAEPWESLLITIEDLEVTNANPDGDRDFGEFVVNNVLRVDDLLFRIEPDPNVGASFDALTGVFNFSFGNFKLLPRSDRDVLGYTVDLCAGVQCPAPGPTCDGRDRLTFTGAGTCDPNLGTCDFSQVTQRQTCAPQACVGGACVEEGPGRLMISEVFYDAAGGDDTKEWVELFNGTDAAIDLSGFSLGGGGRDYTNTRVQLSGTIPPGGCFVVGGPTSDDTNANPTFDLAVDFVNDLQNGGSESDGVALFNTTADQINAMSVPIDAVIYDSPNDNGLLDGDGQPGAPDVEDAPEGQSIERAGLDQWRIQTAPTPNDCTILTR